MKNLLVIGYVWPEPNSSAAGGRMMQLLNIFQQLDYKVSFASPALESDYMVDLESLGINKKSIELNKSSFDEYVKVLNPDVVLFDRFMMEEQFSWRVEKQCPFALRILDTVDLHCLRFARLQALKDKRDVNQSDYINETALREVASILRSDLSLLTSDYEIKLLKTAYQVDEKLLLHTPFMYDSLDEKVVLKKWQTYEERKNFVTIGNFRHEPNWDSILYLKNTIWPLIRKQKKEAELHVYGAYPPKKAKHLHNPNQGFYVKGWAADVVETLQQYRICLAPLRFGAGIKGKLADAMLSGTPSVTTKIGAEAMQEKYDWPGLISENEDSFAEAAINLYQNKKVWQQSQLNGIKIINSVFNKQKHEKIFHKKLSSTIEALEENRNNNFTGLMLRHHSMKSTMYMSQWIEAKNKLDK